MPDQFVSALPYILPATGAGSLGSALSLFREPGAKIRSVVQHFVAGAAALIYRIAEELLVETIEQEKSIFPTATFFAGFMVLLALKLLG